MISNWKTIAVGFFVASSFGWMCISEAAGQFLQQPRSTGNAGKTQQAPFGQPGMTQKPGASPQAHPGATAKSNETYCIVEVGKELQVVSKPNGLKDLKKRIEDDYKTANKAYQDAKKDKANKGVTLEKPEKKTVKEIKSGIKTEDKAREELQKLQADRDKNGAKKSTR